MITKISVATNVGVVVRSVPALKGATRLVERARERQHREDRQEAAQQHGDAPNVADSSLTP